MIGRFLGMSGAAAGLGAAAWLWWRLARPLMGEIDIVIERAPRAGATSRRPPELARVSTRELCRRDGPISTDHLPVGVVRGRLLDELGHRDPVGFALWLLADPLTGSDPWCYLGGSHDPVAGLPEGCRPGQDTPLLREEGHHDGF